MPFSIIRNNIVNMHTDAVVCPSNSSLLPGGGTCGAIFSAAGYEKLLEACQQYRGCRVGHAVITPGFDLPAKYIIHTVGPIWQDGYHREGQLLRSAYLSSLKLAVENGCASVAFPLISAGTYEYPTAEAMSIAREAIRDFLLKDDTDLMVYLVVYDDNAFRVSQELVGQVESFIDSRQAALPAYDASSLHYNDAPGIRRQFEEQLGMADEEEGMSRLFPRRTSALRPSGSRRPASRELPDTMGAPEYSRKESAGYSGPERPVPPSPLERAAGAFKKALKKDPSSVPKLKTDATLDDIMSGMGDSFSVYLLKLIDRRGLKDSEVYKNANLDRKLFSKIRCNPEYQPKKSTVLALCLSLELTLDETRDLLGRAGYALSPADRTDLIVEYFILHQDYNIYSVNEMLFHYGLKLLGSG